MKEVYSINNSGQVIGWADGGYLCCAFLYENGSMTALPPYFFPTVINNNGQIVGDFINDDGEYHAGLYENGTMIDLGLSPGIMGINDLGQIVGNDNRRAFIYESGVMTYLTNDISSTVGYYDYGNTINNKGQIIGIARTVSTEGSHAVLWNPVSVVPEPVSSILFIIGGTLLVGRRYIRRTP